DLQAVAVDVVAEGFAEDGHLVHRAGAVEDDLVVGGDLAAAEEDALDLGGVEVDAADDHHVVVAAADAAHLDGGATAETGAGFEGGDVAGAVADEGEGFLGQGGEDELAFLTGGKGLAGFGIDDLGEEVVFLDVRPSPALGAFGGDARSDDLRETVHV